MLLAQCQMMRTGSLSMTCRICSTTGTSTWGRISKRYPLSSTQGQAWLGLLTQQLARLGVPQVMYSIVRKVIRFHTTAALPISKISPMQKDTSRGLQHSISFALVLTEHVSKEIHTFNFWQLTRVSMSSYSPRQRCSVLIRTRWQATLYPPL